MDRQKLIDEAKKQLDEFNSQLDDLEVKMKEFSGEAKKVYEKQAVELRKLVGEAEKNFEKAKNASEESWNEVKDFVEFTGKALRNSFNYFLSHYKKKQDSQS
jgi:archaellum component FlaC